MDAVTSYIVTTATDPTDTTSEAAIELAEKLGVLFVERKRFSLSFLKKHYSTEQLVVYTTQGPVVHTIGGKYFFHLSMAELRIKNLVNGMDHMVNAMRLKSGMSVLDCTLGQATDAIVASYVVGEHGAVTGIEHSQLLAMIARIGLSSFEHYSDDVTGALRRIDVVAGEALAKLQTLSNSSFDVVYFDPMFRHPVYNSTNLKPLRALADNRAVTHELLYEAKRVCRQRVVLKEKNGSPEFERLGFEKFEGGKHSQICFGIMEK